MKNRIILFISSVTLIIIFGLTLPSKKAKVVVCDVGQGDAILATYKNIQILIDVGPNNKKVLSCLDRYMPFWDKRIEMIILTHGDSDHIGGLSDILRSYKIDNFYSNGLLNQNVEQKISSKKIGQNDVINTNMFDFEVVNPTKNDPTTADVVLTGRDENKDSIVGYLRTNNWSMFMTGDMDLETEQRLVWREILDKKVDVLKVSHHGSESATSDEILDLLKPKVAVISVGKDNRFGHPRKEALERLNLRNIEIKRTDEIGNVVFELN